MQLVRSGLTRSFKEALDDEARSIGAAYETPFAQVADAAFAGGAATRAGGTGAPAP